jgi:hypothetical protein
VCALAFGRQSGRSPFAAEGWAETRAPRDHEKTRKKIGLDFVF